MLHKNKFFKLPFYHITNWKCTFISINAMNETLPDFLSHERKITKLKSSLLKRIWILCSSSFSPKIIGRNREINSSVIPWCDYISFITNVCPSNVSKEWQWVLNFSSFEINVNFEGILSVIEMPNNISFFGINK